MAALRVRCGECGGGADVVISARVAARGGIMPETVLITYDGLPASAGGAHIISGKNPMVSWLRARHFIETFANIVTESRHIEFYRGCEEAREFLPTMWQRFGLHPRKKIISASESSYIWRLDERRATWAARWMEEISPLPDHWRGPIQLVHDAQFKLMDPDTREDLPNQGADHDFQDDSGRMTSLSNFRLSMTNRVSLSLWLVLPFAPQTAEFESYVRRLGEEAPFELSNENWRWWRYSKAGNLYPRKLVV
jgi:hypothetical protein